MNQDYLRLFETESDYDSAKDSFVYPTVSYVRDVDEVKYMSKPLRNYFFIEALADGMTVTLSNSSQGLTAPANDLEYSTDQQVWTSLSNNVASPAINTGERIYLRGNATVDDGGSSMGFFNITQSCNVGGNIMSLLFNDDFEDKTDLTGYNYVFISLFNGQPIVNASELLLPAITLADYCYYDMFRDCTSLTTAPELPATTLAESCYGSMFRDCTSLTATPELPATTLADYCYGEMFDGCTSLTTAPALPATTLTYACYKSMFNGCTLLTTAPELPATTLLDGCYESMFDGCTLLTTAPALPATTLAVQCYESMFKHCTNLTTTPALPATTLAERCYYDMFRDCTSLTTTPELPATTLAGSCYSSMFQGCTSLTTAPELPATTLAGSCYSSMFQGCTSLVIAPELPATTLAIYCYASMFEGCSNLNYIKMLATDISASNCLYRWVYQVSSTGTFVKNPALSEATIGRGANGIPNGWTVVDAE